METPNQTDATPKKIGVASCLCCGEKIAIRSNGRGTVNASCNHCDFSAWAKQGTEAAEIILGSIEGEDKKTGAKLAPVWVGNHYEMRPA